MDGDTMKNVVNITCDVLNQMNNTAVFSPITLNGDWSKVKRLLTLLTFSVCGSLGNIFMISSVMVESHLRKTENSPIAAIALADLLVNVVVFPMPAIVLISEIHEIPSLCEMQWYTGVLDFLVCIESSLLIAIENYWRLCSCKDSYITASPRNNRDPEPAAKSSLSTARGAYVIIGITWCVTSALAAFQMIYSVGFDYCKKKYVPMNLYQFAAVIAIVVIPSVVTILVHMKTFYVVRRLMKRNDFKRSEAFMNDYELMKSNVWAHLSFIVFWMPFSLIVSSGTIESVSEDAFYKTFWLGMIKTIIVPYLYCLTNHNFRESFVSLFKYCCCKSTSTVVRRPRNDVRMRLAPRYQHRAIFVQPPNLVEHALVH